VPLVWVDKAWTGMLGRAAKLLVKKPAKAIEPQKLTVTGSA
jgi:hypothetical protein